MALMGYGDELMVSGRARVMQQSDPRKVQVTYQGVAQWRRWAAVWENNPRIARQGEAGDFQILEARDRNNLRPYQLGKSPSRWTYNLAFRPDVGEIYFSEAEKAFGLRHAARIVVEPHIKAGASPNKDWGLERWRRLAALMQGAGHAVTQLGPPGTRLLDGAELVVTTSFREACAVLAHARAAVLPEGGLHHAAAACGIPAVVIYGGYIPVELTGYAMHRNLGVSLGDACGMRVPCRHCAKQMAEIPPELVMRHLEEVLDEADRRGVAA